MAWTALYHLGCSFLEGGVWIQFKAVSEKPAPQHPRPPGPDGLLRGREAERVGVSDRLRREPASEGVGLSFLTEPLTPAPDPNRDSVKEAAPKCFSWGGVTSQGYGQ